MGAPAIWWIYAVAGALLSGLALVGVFVAVQAAEKPAIAIVLAGGATSAYSLAQIASTYARADAVLYAFAFVLAALGGGYSLGSTLLFRLAKPLMAAHLDEALAPADPTTAVIVLCCVEPARYAPSATAGMLLSLTGEGLLEASIGGLPFLFFAHKSRYRSNGGASPSLAQLIAVAERLDERLGGSASVDWATCSGEHRLAPKVAAAINRGHHRILVIELAVSASGHMQAALAEADNLGLETYDVVLEHLDGVTCSDGIADALVDRILDTTGDSDSAGVVLVGHGQPEELARRNPGFGEEEMIFLSRLRVLLTDKGIAGEHIRVAWSEWVEPDVTSEVRHLAALGCQRIAVVPAVFPVDSLATRLDLHHAARQARVDETVEVTLLPAWGAEEALIDELTTLVETSLRR